MNYREFKEKMLSDPELRNEYEKTEPEYQLIAEIVKYRIEQSLSQQDLANITGINRADISRIESGNANPSLKTLKRIAEGLGKHLEIHFV